MGIVITEKCGVVWCGVVWASRRCEASVIHVTSVWLSCLGELLERVLQMFPFREAKSGRARETGWFCAIAKKITTHFHNPE